MTAATAWSSLLCRKLCAGACEVRNRAMKGGACCRIVQLLSDLCAVACLRSGVRLGFAPDAIEGANGALGGRKWQEDDRKRVRQQVM